MLRRRRKRIVRDADQDESVGLSGWLYTDLMLGLTVVFLGAVVVTIPKMQRDESGQVVEIVTTSTTSTTTTTTIPIRLCKSLFVPDDKRNDQLVIYVGANSDDSHLVSEFQAGLATLYGDLNARPEVQLSNYRFDVETTKIGLILARAGSPRTGVDTSENATGVRARLAALLPNIMESTPGRDSYSTNIDQSQVGMEVLPLIELPCAEN